MTDLLRLSKLFVASQYEEDGTLIIETKSKNPRSPKRCCLLHSLDKNGTKRQRFRDHPVQGQPTMLEVVRQRFKCSFCGATHYEELPDVDGDRRITVRFRTYLEDQAIRLPFTQVAALNGVHETLIRRLFEERAARDLADYKPSLPRVLGMDEIYLHKRARFVIGDVANKTMLDMQPGRRDVDLRAYFEPLSGRDRVEVVCQDMWKGYHTLTKAMFPNAVTVIDKYHVQRTANYGMEVVRKALYHNLSNKDRIALKRQRAVFLARWETCKPETRTRLDRLFGLYPALATAYDLKERFYDIYEAESRAAAEEATTRWLASVPSEFERPFKTSIDAINNWRPHILRYFEHRYTSGYVERLNGLIRAMNRSGTGYSFEVLRAKALLKHGRIIGPADRLYSLRIGEEGAAEAPEIPSLWLLGIELSTLEADLEAGTF
ncbi:ISL3 family transposase [Methylobacterium sp. NPDC080182]|uniref:ISL3 family transposase n=1 Tax=Methylobacterium sp. NPDC080182 TaxID=3390590 RepID=UPI003D04F824